MAEVAVVEVAAGFGVIANEAPPVNALGHKVRSAILDALTACETDPAVEIAVLICRGRTFFAGAEISELSARRRRRACTKCWGPVRSRS